MFSLETSLFALLLFAGSVLLVRWHWVAWQTAAAEQLDEKNRKFLHDQYRRRVQASGMIGVIGIAMFVGQFLSRWPVVNVFHWAGVLLLAFWVILLAGADLLVTRNYLGRVRRDQLMDAMRYYAEQKRRDGEDPSADHEAPG
jgi:hypothetical protein